MKDTLTAQVTAGEQCPICHAPLALHSVTPRAGKEDIGLYTFRCATHGPVLSRDLELVECPSPPIST